LAGRGAHTVHFQLWQLPIILAVGFVAGFVNTMAGGGSLLTLPLLIFLGLPSAVANGTNRVAVVMQSGLAVLGFRSKGVSDLKLSLQFAIPVVLGSLLGARLAIDIPDLVFQRVLAAVMVLVLALILWDPARRLAKPAVAGKLLPGEAGATGTTNPAEAASLPTPPLWRRLLAIALLFVAGVYGGFIQAGLGFVLIAILMGITGLNLVRVNAHKVFVVAISTAFSLAVFVLEGKVDWILGLTLSLGNGSGGWVAGRLAASKGERVIRPVLVIAVLVMAVRLSGIIPGWR
jgi:uncharacterized protein